MRRPLIAAAVAAFAPLSVFAALVASSGGSHTLRGY